MRFLFNWPVRVHLTLLVWAAVLPALVIILSLGYAQQRATEAQLHRDSINTTRELASGYLAMVQDTRRLLTTIAEMPEVREGRLERSTELLTRLLTRNPQFNTLQITGIDGIIRASGTPLTGQVSVADRKYFREATSQRMFAAGDYIVGRTTGVKMLNFAQPVFDGDARLISIVQAGFDLQHFERLLTTAVLPEGAEVILCDAAGTILSRYPANNRAGVGSPDDPTLFARMAGEPEGSFTTQTRRGAWFASYRQFRLAPTQPPYMYLRVLVPQSAILQPSWRMFYQNLGLMLGAGLLATLAAWYLGGTLILRPVQRLAATARELGAGRLDPQIRLVHRAREFTRLAEAFAEMATLLAARERERNEVEATLRASEQRFRQLMENSMVGFAVIRAGRLLHGNQALARMLGAATPDSLVQQNVLDWVMPEDTALLADKLHQREQGLAAISSYEIHLRKIDGTLLPVLTQSMLLDLPDGEAILVALIDITAQKRSETERTRLEDQLRQSQKMEAIGRLAGGVAHDFNNILTSILGFAELTLQNPTLPGRVRQDVQEIHLAAERAAELTRQLLTFSRKQVLQPRVISLDETIRESQKMIQRLLGEVVELQHRPSLTAGFIQIDPTQIGQILVNLAVNARDAMPQGGKLILTTDTATLDESVKFDGPAEVHPGRWVVLTVRDTGCGISPEHLSLIFEPFFTTKEAGRGTGLGLATVYGIVHQSGGFIKVYSEVGLGTTFTLYFPQVEAPAAAAAPTPRGDFPRGTETILLVDDNAAVRYALQRFLSSLGYTVLPAEDGPAALQLYAQHAANLGLLFTDIVMPGINGWQLYEQLRQRQPQLRALFMSGYTENRQVLAAGINFIPKPCDFAELARRLRLVLESAPAPLAGLAESADGNPPAPQL